MSSRTLLLPLLLAALPLLAGPVAAQYQAAGKVTWNYDETTTGADVNWVSPTTVDPSAIEFNTTSSIELVEVGWSYLFFSGVQDVTGEIPPEQLNSTGPVPGPGPLALFAAGLVFPEPPEPPTISADLSIGLDATGHGYFSAENVVLGTATLVVPIFGTVTVNITSIRVKGSLTFHATWFDAGPGLNGTFGQPLLMGTGSFEPGSAGQVSLSSGVPGGTGFLVLSTTLLSAPFKGGTLVPFPDFIFPLPLDGAGEFVVPYTWPTGIPARVPVYLQCWIPDAGGPVGFSASNGLQGVTP